MSDTQFKTAVPIDETGRRACSTAQWMLELSQDKETPPFHRNNLSLYICGEDAFKQIAEDLKNAKSSIEIICWGFDPAMELIREKTVWPRGDTWGGLLKDVAEGKYNGGKPVEIRLLSWYGFIGNAFTNNMPGFRKTSKYETRYLAEHHRGSTFLPSGQRIEVPPPTDPQDQREVFNSQWFDAAAEGRLKNIVIRTRSIDSETAAKSLAAEPGKRGFFEAPGMTTIATDHQKTILIDYAYQHGTEAVCYVMGLNSVTDYWDTQAHLFHDPRRGEGWEGANDTTPGLKPYQDYACRIRGEALVAVSKNFTNAWNRAKSANQADQEKLKRHHDFRKPPAGLAANLTSPLHRAMIVRTQPEEGDKSIKRLYQQASSFARQYLYVENQYFQYTEWAQQLKAYRKAFVNGLQAGGKTLADIPTLHVMVVIPTPERKEMVPRTYDTVKSLGNGTSMPNQDKEIEEEIEAYERNLASIEAFNQKSRSPHAMPPRAMELSGAAKSTRELGKQIDISTELAEIGMRTLVGSLWTFDSNWRTTQSKELAPTNEWGGKPVESQHRKLVTEHVNHARFREIYIHSKLMLIDDSMFTLGSANLNLRSMSVDAEINIASDDEGCAADLRRRVWTLHTGGANKCNPWMIEPNTMTRAFQGWRRLMLSNADSKTSGAQPIGFIFPFYDKRTSKIRLG